MAEETSNNPGRESAEAVAPPGLAPDDAAADAAGEGAQTDCLPPDADPYFIGEFITESRENIEAAEAALLSLETDPEDSEAINTVFRAFHTVKGISMWLGLARLADLAHHAESLLSRAREREIRCTGGYADLALRSVDMLKELISVVQGALERDGALPVPEGYDELLRVLTDPEAAGVTSEQAAHAAPRLGDILVAEGKAEREMVEAVAAASDDPIGMALVKSEAASLADVAGALRTQQRIANAESGAGGQAPESSVRVRTDRLDGLIDMIGELVIAHSMVAQDESVLDGARHELLRKVSHTGKIVRELQDLSLSMRMVPLKATFQKMTRLVRDLAQKGGKVINLVTEGDDTEIDRNMVDVINDPLMHMVRNACDHGVETPDVREAAGKPAAGTVRLSAYHSGGSVVIELRDDGRGLSRRRIVEKAVSRGLIEPDRELSDAEVFNLIFEPGFSTAEKVTDISGRGVGMDVVKRKIEAVRGRIDIASEEGKGSTFALRLPLTLAITDGMLVRVGAERYIIPTVNIHLSFQPEPSAVSTVAGGGEMVRLREELMPIFRLHRLFGVPEAETDPACGLLVVVDDGKRRCAILVDELLGKQQVVAKSLGAGLKTEGITGGAILGDGRVGLILDPAEIVMLARSAEAVEEAAGVM
jgi:two-component system, chemotaxis family, sensor kinase CheA